MTDLKHNIYDSFFTHLFSYPEYALQLYQTLHKEDKDITVEDIDIKTLTNVFSNQIYNDFGMLVKDRLLIFVEAQSTWNPNIIYRCKYYANSTELRYIEEKKINLFSKAPVRMPVCEFYCVYTGEKGNHPDILKLSEEYFDGKNIDNDIIVHMIYGNKESHDILNQYIRLCTIIKEMIIKYEKPKLAIEETLKICQNEGILEEYLKNISLEVFTMEILDIFDQEWVTEVTKIENERIAKEMAEKAAKEASEKAAKEASEKAAKEERINTVLSLYKKNKITIEDVCEELNLTQEDVNQLLQQ